MWLTNAPKSAQVLDQCRSECTNLGTEQSIPREAATPANKPELIDIDDWQMLQPSSSAKVESIFCEDSTANECVDDAKTTADHPQSPIADFMSKLLSSNEGDGVSVRDNGRRASVLGKHLRSDELSNELVMYGTKGKRNLRKKREFKNLKTSA